MTYDTSSPHSGSIRKPRAAKHTLSGSPIDPTRPINVAHLDGDHVLVGFMDDSRNRPVILCYLPHPRADIGDENKPIGHRTRLRLVYGDPAFVKHHGCFYGVSDAGDIVLDATSENSKVLVATSVACAGWTK